MHRAIASNHLSESLVRAAQHWEQRRAAKEGRNKLGAALAPTIAISRQTGARGSTVAQQVGTQLEWPVYDHELLERIASEMHVRVSLLESIDERMMPWLEERIETFMAVPAVSSNSFFRHLVQTVLSLGEHGQSIIVGRGASYMLPARSTLRVRLVADREDRIAVMTRELGVSLDEAARHVRDADRARAQYVKEHFRADIADPLHYDLTLNTSRLTVAQCAALVVTALHDFEKRLPDEPLRHAAAH